MAKTAKPLQTYPRLTAYTEENFQGRSAIYLGNLGIADLDKPLGGIESYRGNHVIVDLDVDFIGGSDAESLISTNDRLTLDQVRAIRDSGNLPSGYRRL